MKPGTLTVAIVCKPACAFKTLLTQFIVIAQVPISPLIPPSTSEEKFGVPLIVILSKDFGSPIAALKMHALFYKHH